MTTKKRKCFRVHLTGRTLAPARRSRAREGHTHESMAQVIDVKDVKSSVERRGGESQRVERIREVRAGAARGMPLQAPFRLVESAVGERVQSTFEAGRHTPVPNH